MINPILNRLKNNSGMALTASTMFIFIVLSIMAFYLARFAILDSASAANYIQNIRARNLVQTGLQVGLLKIENSYSSLGSAISGKLNKGSYNVLVDNNKDEKNSNLKYNHYSLLKSSSEIGGISRSARLIVSSYPNAFNLALFSKNQGNGTFSSNSSNSISGDLFFNGAISSVSMASNSVAYSSVESSSSPIVFHGLPLPSLPTLDHSTYTTLLNSVTGQFNSSNSSGQSGTSSRTVWNPNGGHCNVCKNDGDSNNRYACTNGYGGWSNSHSFNDFVPSGSTVNKITIRFKGATPCGGTWNIAPSVNGQVINSESWYGSRCSCNSCAVKDVVSANHTNGFPSYKYGASNSLTFSHSGARTCIGYVQVIIAHSASSTPGVGENETINLSNYSNKTLMHDGDLTLTGCNITGPGYVLASGNIIISGNTSIGGGVKIFSKKSIEINGSSTIGSSLTSYCTLYGTLGLNIKGSKAFGLFISSGSLLSLTNSTISGAVFSEASGNTLSNITLNGSIVTKNNLSLTSSSIIKNSLPDLFGVNTGFKPSIIPGSYLEF